MKLCDTQICQKLQKTSLLYSIVLYILKFQKNILFMKEVILQ